MLVLLLVAIILLIIIHLSAVASYIPLYLLLLDYNIRTNLSCRAWHNIVVAYLAIAIHGVLSRCIILMYHDLLEVVATGIRYILLDVIVVVATIVIADATAVIIPNRAFSR